MLPVGYLPARKIPQRDEYDSVIEEIIAEAQMVESKRRERLFNLLSITSRKRLFAESAVDGGPRRYETQRIKIVRCVRCYVAPSGMC